jgi:hypothetical protein
MARAGLQGLVWRKPLAKLRADEQEHQLMSQIARVRELHNEGLIEGFGSTSVPKALHRKFGSAMKDFTWQYLFPLFSRCFHPNDGYVCRNHLHHFVFSKQLREAVLASGVQKRVTAHTFRHAFATEILRTGRDTVPFRILWETAISERLRFTRTLSETSERGPSAHLIDFEPKTNADINAL